MQIGSIIKSLDFPGIPQHYMVGKVVSISKMDSTIRCEVLKVVENGKIKKTRIPDFFVTPLPDFHFLDASFPGRLTLLD